MESVEGLMDISDIRMKEYEFQMYLKDSEVMESIMNALAYLYEEPNWPNDPIQYLRVKLGDTSPPKGTLEYLECLLGKAKERITYLKNHLSSLKYTNKCQLLGEEGIKRSMKELLLFDGLFSNNPSPENEMPNSGNV